MQMQKKAQVLLCMHKQDRDPCRGGRAWNGFLGHGKCAGLKILWLSAFVSSNLTPCI